MLRKPTDRIRGERRDVMGSIEHRRAFQIAADRVGVRRSRSIKQRSQVGEFLIELRFRHAVLLNELA